MAENNKEEKRKFSNPILHAALNPRNRFLGNASVPKSIDTLRLPAILSEAQQYSPYRLLSLFLFSFYFCSAFFSTIFYSTRCLALGWENIAFRVEEEEKEELALTPTAAGKLCLATVSNRQAVQKFSTQNSCSCVTKLATFISFSLLREIWRENWPGSQPVFQCPTRVPHRCARPRTGLQSDAAG